MPQLKKTHKGLNYVFIIVGAILVGIAYNVFLLPAQLAAGGISGVSTILHELYNTKPALVQALINLPLLDRKSTRLNSSH